MGDRERGEWQCGMKLMCVDVWYGIRKGEGGHGGYYAGEAGGWYVLIIFLILD